MRRLPPSLAGHLGRARPWPRRLARLASLGLPQGATRERYRREFLADLDGLGPSEQAAYTARMLLGVPSLRLALNHIRRDPMEVVMTTPRKPLRCRLRFHRWEWAQTTDGEQYQRCARCLTERWTGLKDDRSVAASLIANYGSAN